MIQLKCVLKNKKIEIFLKELNSLQYLVLKLIILNIIMYVNCSI